MLVTCKHCGRMINKENAITAYSASTGRTNKIYFCRPCAERTEGYTDENTIFTNKRTAKGFTYSIEFEISRECEKSLAELAALQQYGWMPSHDCTVKVEYKSIIYQNKNALVRTLKSVDKIVNIEQWNTATDYGTHLNMNASGLRLDYVARFYNSLFTDFTQFMYQHGEKNAEFFGRNFNRWAIPVDMESNTGTHENAYNMQHTTHLELRLPRYKNWKQYIQVINFESEIIEKLVDFSNWMQENDSTLTAKEKRAKAKKISQQMIKIYCKYTGIEKQYMTKGYKKAV